MADVLYLHEYRLYSADGYAAGTEDVVIEAPVGYRIVSGTSTCLVGLEAEPIEVFNWGSPAASVIDGSAATFHIVKPEITFGVGEYYIVGLTAVAVHGHSAQVDVNPIPEP